MKFIMNYVFVLILIIWCNFGSTASLARVLNFFDIAEIWDWSLAFVMGGALVL